MYHFKNKTTTELKGITAILNNIKNSTTPRVTISSTNKYSIENRDKSSTKSTSILKTNTTSKHDHKDILYTNSKDKSNQTSTSKMVQTTAKNVKYSNKTNIYNLNSTRKLNGNITSTKMSTIISTIKTLKPVSFTTKKMTTTKIKEEDDYEFKNEESKNEYESSYETESITISNYDDLNTVPSDTTFLMETSEYITNTDFSDSVSYSLETEMSTNSEYTITDWDNSNLNLISEETSDIIPEIATSTKTGFDETELLLYSTEITTLSTSTKKPTLIQTKPTKFNNILATTISNKISSIANSNTLSSTKYSSISKIFETSSSSRKPTSTDTKKTSTSYVLINECSNFCLNQGECFLKTYDQDLVSHINNTKTNKPAPNCKCKHYNIIYGLILVNYSGQRCEILTYSFTYISLGISFIGIIVFILLVILILILFKIIFSRKSQNTFSVEYHNKVYKPELSSNSFKKLDDSDWSKKFRTIRDSWKLIRFSKNSKNNRLNKIKTKKSNETINTVSKKLFIKDNILKNYSKRNIKKDKNIFDLNENFIFVNRNKSSSHLFGSGSNIYSISSTSSLNKLDKKFPSNIFIYPKPSRGSNITFFKSDADWW